MTAPLTIGLIQARHFTPGDYLRVEVDGVLDSSRHTIWPSERARIGFGHGSFGRGRFGRGRSLGFGVGAFGRGVFGQGARIISVQTDADHEPGGYTIRLHTFDRLHNLGEVSSSYQQEHRPETPPPRSLRISGNNLTWVWP